MEATHLKRNASLQGGKYTITGILGQGGFGITYLGLQVGLNRKVAIKEFFMKDYCNRDLDTSHVSVGSAGSRDLVDRFRQKFIKEAQSIAQLDHPNIVRIHDVFEENGTAYYVMEYVGGGSLQQYIHSQGKLSEIESLHCIREIASALDYLHSRQMNHLDVKPGNVLRRDNGHVVLIDFGLSKRYDESGSQTSSTPVGVSAGYAPIEQYKKGGVSTFSPATDIYSLGAMFYKMLTGATPPEADMVLDEGLPSQPVDVSETLYAAIIKAMQPRRLDRPQSIDAFLCLLNKVEDNEVTIVQQNDVRTYTATTTDETIVDIPNQSSQSQSKVYDNRMVDLGLSVKWANCNVGASSPEEYGGLYGWGDPTGENRSTNLDDYPSANPPNNISGTRYDIARAKWGGSWRLPTLEEFEELHSKCKWELKWDRVMVRERKWIFFEVDREVETGYKGVNGYKVTGPNGNSIFFPAAGNRYGEDVYYRGSRGDYWSGSLYTSNSVCVNSLIFVME